MRNFPPLLHFPGTVLIGQLERGQFHVDRRPVGRRHPAQACQRILRRTQLLVQGRQKRTIVIGLALRAEHIHS